MDDENYKSFDENVDGLVLNHEDDYLLQNWIVFAYVCIENQHQKSAFSFRTLPFGNISLL